VLDFPMILKRSTWHEAPRGPILESLGSARSRKPKGLAQLGLESWVSRLGSVSKRNVSTRPTSLLLILQRFDHYEHKNVAIHALIESW